MGRSQYATYKRNQLMTTINRPIPSAKIMPRRSPPPFAFPAKARDSVVILRNKALCGPITTSSKSGRSEHFKQLAKSMMHLCNESINDMGPVDFASVFTHGVSSSVPSDDGSLQHVNARKNLVKATNRDLPPFFLGDGTTRRSFMKAKLSVPMKTIMTTVEIEERYNGRSTPEARVMFVKFQVKRLYSDDVQRFEYWARLGYTSTA